jgi:hypothetical protein
MRRETYSAMSCRQTSYSVLWGTKPLPSILVFVLLNAGLQIEALAESQWVVPNQVPFQQSTEVNPQREQPAAPPGDSRPSSKQGESKTSGDLPQRQTSVQIRTTLDARLKLALQRARPSNAEPIELGIIAQKCPSAETRQKAVTTFWQVAQVAITIDFVTEALSELESIQARPNDQVTLDSVKQLYMARLYEYRGDLQASMTSLSEIVGAGVDQQPLFPDDIPHTGGYSTQLERLYKEAPPLALRRVHEMIPLARQSVYLHFGAGQSSRDAWLAFKEAYDAQRTDLWTVLTCWRLWVEEQIRLAEAIETYNRLILEYVVTSGHGHIDSESFVRMLLEDGARRVISGANRSTSDAQMKSDRPTGGENGSTVPVDPRQWSLVNSEIAAIFAKVTDSGSRLPLFSPVEQKQGRCPGLFVSTSAEHEGWVQSGLSTPYFLTLPQSSAGVFVQKLAEQSFKAGEIALAESNRGEKVPLDSQFLKNKHRQDRVRLYWDVAVAQGRYCVLVQYSAALSEVFPILLSRWNEPRVAEEMLQLQAFRRIADAALEDAHLEMVKKGFQLLEITGKTNGVQPIASTVPYVGEYDTKWEQVKLLLTYAARATAVRATYELSASYAALCQKGLALNAADQSRVAAAGRFLQGQLGIMPLLQAIQLQCEIWLDFIELTGRYNQLIADYVALVRPDLNETEFLTAIGIVPQ